MAFLVSLLVLAPLVSDAHSLAQIAQTSRPTKGESVSDQQERLLSSANLNDYFRASVYSIILTQKIWANHPVISVCFGPASEVSRQRGLIAQIVPIANEWVANLRVRFDFGAPSYRVCQSMQTADVRVDIRRAATESDAYFQSLIGNESVNAGLSGDGIYSMQLEFADTPKYRLSSVIRFYVLHEFGHALGAGHEHQRMDCDFNYAYIAKTFNFSSPLQAQENMGQIYGYRASAYPGDGAIEDSQYIATKYDNYSVMKYNLSTAKAPGGDDPWVYKDDVRDKCYRATWVSALTTYDKEGMAKAYSNPSLALSLLASLESSKSALAFVAPHPRPAPKAPLKQTPSSNLSDQIELVKSSPIAAAMARKLLALSPQR